MCIPLKYVLPFFEDYKKIIIFSKLELVLVRNKLDDNIFIDDTTGFSAEMVLSKCQWRVSHVGVDDRTQTYENFRKRSRN